MARCRGGAEGEPRGACLRVPAAAPRAGRRRSKRPARKGRCASRVCEACERCGLAAPIESDEKRRRAARWRRPLGRRCRREPAPVERRRRHGPPAVAGTARPAGSAQRLRLRRRPAEAEAACRPFGPTDATDPIAWSTCRSPPPRPPRASTPSAAGAPRLQKSCRWRRPQSKGRSCGSGRARRDLRVRGGRGHLSERP